MTGHPQPLRQHARAAAQHILDRTPLRPRVAMLLGTGLLLTEGGLSPADIQARVAVPGGITAKALSLLQRETGGVFNQLIRTTHAKFREDLSKVSVAFIGEEVNGQ